MYTDFSACRLCPRACGVNRNAGEKGFCGAGALPEVSRVGLHFMEEPVISGTRGSGTVFFAHCTLGCVYCQNFAISRAGSSGRVMDAEGLAEEYLKLERAGAHNINLVTPTHYMPVVLDSCAIARRAGLTLPFVYNTSGFERPEAIDRLADSVTVFLTDLKYRSPYLSERYSHSADYYDFAASAIDRMVEIAGLPEYLADGTLKRGVIIRHLMLPAQGADTAAVLRQIAARWGDRVLVSLMRQYTPVGEQLPPELTQTVTDREYRLAAEEMEMLGLEGFLQEDSAVGTDKIPDWDPC